MDKSIKYNQITKRDIDFFTELVGIENLLTGLNCKNFGSDHTENLNYPPELVVFPQSIT